jgi:hypothetical protein
MMISLQEALQQRHHVIAANLDPIDSPRIMEAMSKLKTALKELHTRNAQLVMRNEKLNLQLYFMPPKMWNSIAKAKRKRSYYYELQRSDPHYLTPVTGSDFMFVRAEPGDRTADRMQRCATVTSVHELLLEVDDVLEYLKQLNGIVDEHVEEHVNEDGEVVEDAIHMAITSDTIHVATATDANGIPTASPVDQGQMQQNIPTVSAMRMRMVQNLLPNDATNDSASKRTHNVTVHTGHTFHASKVQKINPQANLNTNSSAAPAQNTFTGMSSYGAYVHKTSSYFTDPQMDMSSPFAPIGRNIVGYNVMRGNDSSSDNAPHYSSKWTARGKGKGKPSKKGKRSNGPNDRFWTIPAFGKASGDARIVIFTLTQLSESTNLYRKRLPRAFERGNTTIVQLPEPTFVAARKRPDQVTDPDLCLVYHQALKALYQLVDSSRLYLIEDEEKTIRNLLAVPIQYTNGIPVYDLVPENQKLSLGDYCSVRANTGSCVVGVPGWMVGLRQAVGEIQ